MIKSFQSISNDYIQWKSKTVCVRTTFIYRTRIFAMTYITKIKTNWFWDDVYEILNALWLYFYPVCFNIYNMRLDFFPFVLDFGTRHMNYEVHYMNGSKCWTDFKIRDLSLSMIYRGQTNASLDRVCNGLFLFVLPTFTLFNNRLVLSVLLFDLTPHFLERCRQKATGT